MDKGIKHPSPKQAAVANRWDSVETSAESLSQERVHQQQLQMHIGSHDQYKYIQAQNEKTGSLEQGDDDDEDETENLQVYDSLEVLPHTKRNVDLLHTEYLDTHINQREEMSEVLSSDSYSELRYDPNWRTNLKRNGCFSGNPQIYIEEYYPEEESDRQRWETNGGHRYIVDTHPAVVVASHMSVNESDQPYHLHPQDAQTNSVASPNCHKHALQLRSPHADLSRASSVSTVNESDDTSPRRFREKCENGCGNAENISTSPELTEDVHASEFLTDPRHTQKMSTSTLTSPKVLPNKKLERQTKDIVERNKITLGRNTSKCGSYMRVHTFIQEMPHHINKVHESLKEAASTENQDDTSDSELRWLQKTQQLRVTQINKGKKAQRKEYPDPSQPQQLSTPGVKTEWGDHLSSPLARAVSVTQPKSQKMASSQTLPTTIHLNINLNTSPHLLSLLQQKGQDAVTNLAALLGHPHWSHASKVQLALSPGNQQTDSAQPFLMSPERINVQLHEQNLESSPEHCQKRSALKLPLSCDGEDQVWNPNKDHTKQVPQNLPRTPTTASSHFLGSFPVLPPIGKPPTGKDHELRRGQCVNTGRPIHRSSSDSYLSQMEKKKQLREKITYKEYSLKDYKQLKPDTNLRGLGPDYTAPEKTKMKRQKLYSNVICEQNKKISRIPFLLAKDLEGSDKKVPRMKALEYAKTIAKPPLQPQPKQRQKQQPEGFTEYSPYLQGLDASQLATLELLRKRHEEEKQAVEHLRKVHAV